MCCPLFFRQSGRRQQGFSVLTLLFGAIILAAGLAFLLIGNGPNMAGMVAGQKSTQLIAQAQFIAQRIVKCATDYPAGNNGQASHINYPADGNPGAIPVAALVCPGSGQNLWSGADGVYLPVAITDFSGWTYTNASPVVISVTAIRPGQYTAAISDAATHLGSSAIASGDTLTVKVIE